MDKNIILKKKQHEKNKQINIINNINTIHLLSSIKKYPLTTFNNNSSNVALMLESRMPDNTEIVLRQFSRFLPSDFAMWIYVTENVYSLYLELAKKLNNNINIILLPSQYILNSVKDYNDIMLDITFWNLLIKFKRVLVFQTDTMIYRKGIEEFYDYDYIGAPWNNNLFSIKNEPIMNVGNGGLSLRNINAIIYCLENKKKVIIPQYNEKKEKHNMFGKDPEDVFYSYAMNQFGYKIPNAEIASLFSIEASRHNNKCLASHKLIAYNISLHIDLLYNSVYKYNIPLKIYQTWYTKNLIKNLQECSDSIKNSNPEFEYYLYDDDDCRKFIKDNFNEEILWTYDNLLAGAYKADLWRYCILYKTGGIYIDIKYKCINNFKFIYLTDKDYYVLDRTIGWYNEQKGLYNGFIVTSKENPLFLKLINNIVYNVKNNFYGLNSLHPTGPLLFGILYEQDNKKINKNDFELVYSECGMYISLNNMNILEIYKEYRMDSFKFSNKKHYGVLWNIKNIYSYSTELVNNSIEVTNILKEVNWKKALFIYEHISNNNDHYINLCINHTSYDNIINFNINFQNISNIDLLNKKSNYSDDLQNLLDNNKLITTRLGVVESSFILKYKYNFAIYEDHLKYNEQKLDYYMKRNAGLYYIDDKHKKVVLDWWCNNTCELIKKSTITSCYAALHYDLALWSYLDIRKKFYDWGKLHKFILKNISNKKVLYIGSAVKSIKFAHSNIQKMWKFDIGNFEMYYVQTPQTTLDMTYPDTSIIDTTDKIVNKIISNYSDFDIAILGCGAYGPPLINILHKKLGDKNMIYLGSSCYTMFGIYSDGMPIPDDNDVIKENWIEVLEKCNNKCKNIDNGKYWKL
jgi:mannosyltransferase OCH1-like enzyme/uncharacterized protein YciU (UPF0263 family)